MTMNSTSPLLIRMDNATAHGSFTATIKIASSALLLLTFLFGLIVNSLYLWVLQFRMRKTMNTTWFFHLILANFFYTITLPFFALYFLTKPQWIFGLFMCKFVNSLLSVCMYGSVFVLTVISLDRYCLVFHPHWYRKFINPHKASMICLVLWVLAVLFSSPYLAFRQLTYTSNMVICYNDYTLSGKLEGQWIKWLLFSFRLVVGFIVPLAIITICYLSIFSKMRREGLARSTRPYKIIITAIVSFFISYIPYYLWYGMGIEEGRFPQITLQLLQIMAIILSCIYSCLTPILYLFIVESFRNMFRKSLVTLIELVVNETYTLSNRSLEDKRESQTPCEII